MPLRAAYLLYPLTLSEGYLLMAVWSQLCVCYSQVEKMFSWAERKYHGFCFLLPLQIEEALGGLPGFKSVSVLDIRSESPHCGWIASSTEKPAILTDFPCSASLKASEGQSGVSHHSRMLPPTLLVCKLVDPYGPQHGPCQLHHLSPVRIRPRVRLFPSSPRSPS